MGPKVTFSHIGHWSLFQEKVFESVLTNEDFPEIQQFPSESSHKNGLTARMQGTKHPDHADLLRPMGMAAVWEQMCTLAGFKTISFQLITEN